MAKSRFSLALYLALAEIGRHLLGPAKVVRICRRTGQAKPLRTLEERLDLRRRIYAMDTFVPGLGNCFRRVLAEIALDAETANEPLHLGLMRGGGSKSGHAWLESDPKPARTYDVEFVM